MPKHPLLGGLLLLLLASPGMAAGKKKVKPVPAAEPVLAAPPPEAPPPPRPVEPPPPPPSAVAPVPAPAPVEVANDEPVPLPVLAPRAGLLLQVAGGVVVPFEGLGVGGRGEARVSWLLASAPLGFSLSFGFEQHTAKTAAFLPPPAGGFDAAGLDNQTLYPAQLLAHVLLLRDERNRLQLGAGYALLIAWTQTQALGRTREETGLGHEVVGELAYSRRFGAFELELRARYSVRRTAVGPYTTALELPWYQTFGALLGVGLWP